MKVEEIKLAFETNVQLTLIDDVNNAFAKGLSLSDVSKALINAQTNVKSAIGMYETALKFAEKGTVSAKELGATDTVSLLAKKSDMISVAKKSAESVLSSIGSALSSI